MLMYVLSPMVYRLLQFQCISRKLTGSTGFSIYKYSCFILLTAAAGEWNTCSEIGNKFKNCETVVKNPSTLSVDQL